jgi:hypothetical protein
MARAGRFRIGAMEALWSQLQYAPAAAAQRMIGRIRSFAATLEPESLYAPSAVVREVVRFPLERPLGDSDAMLVGAALRADLAELAFCLSRRVPARAGEIAMELPEAARACSVSVRTLRRWHGIGLPLHWINAGNGTLRAGVLRADLDAFVGAHAGRASRAARFTQISSRERQSIRDAVRTLRAAGASERRVLARVAADHGRSVGAVRALVVPVMERSRSAAHRRELVRKRGARLWKSWVRGIPVGAAARHLGISDRMAQHALRAERWRMLELHSGQLAGFARGIAVRDVSEPEWAAASAGLAVAALPAEGALSLRWPAGIPRPRCGALAVVARALSARAASHAASLSARATSHAASASRPAAASARRERTRTATALDRSETDIRWASRIMLTIATDSMAAVAARVKAWRASGEGVPLSDRELESLALRSILEACGSDVASLRSGRTRIDRLAGAQMDLALARATATRTRTSRVRLPAHGEAGAARRELALPWSRMAPLHDARAARLGLSAWCSAPAAHTCASATMPEGMLQRRYGWHGGAPMTMEEIAAEAGRPEWVVANAVARAWRGRLAGGIGAR